MIKESKWLKEYKAKKRPFYVDAQKTTYEAFIDEIEFDEAYPENEYMAIKVIEMLKQKYNLIF